MRAIAIAIVTMGFWMVQVDHVTRTVSGPPALVLMCLMMLTCLAIALGW